MKIVIVSLIICFYSVAVSGQDSLRYDYAILEVDIPDLSVEYSNGAREDLMEKLKLSKKESRHQLIFRSFEYLNDKGYELMSSNIYLQWNYFEKVTTDQTEYTFKRKKNIK